MTGRQQLVVPGREILREVLTSYRPYRPAVTARQPKAVIVRFDPDPEHAPPDWIRRMIASRISADQKKRMFRNLGVRVDEIVFSGTPSRAEFTDRLSQANGDPAVVALIVQLPAPALLVDALDQIDPAKDIDAIGTAAEHRACATADGIVRIAHPFLTHGHPVAVVGGRGFVGSGVVELLRKMGHEAIALGVADDLRQVRDADVVISATGQAGLLTSDHLHSGQALVVDAGFIPHLDGARGDIAPPAAALPRAITPVPGGVGPVEMAVLAERLLRMTVAPDLHPWRFLGRATPPTTDATAVVAAQLGSSKRPRSHADGGEVRRAPQPPPRRPPPTPRRPQGPSRGL